MEYPKWVLGKIVIDEAEEASWRAQAEGVKAEIAAVVDEPERAAASEPTKKRGKKAH